MKNNKVISTLVLIVSALAIIASATGIFSTGGSQYEFQSLMGQTVTIYGVGVYKHMSADVAIQGIAQDYVTLFIAIPALLFALFLARKRTLKSKYLLAGILSYFFLTYLFYRNMAMYNALFLVYIVLTGTSFFALTLTLISIEIDKLPTTFNEKTPVKLIFLSFLMTALIAKIIAMSLAGVNVVPVVFIIPCITIVAIVCSIITLKNIHNNAI